MFDRIVIHRTSPVQVREVTKTVIEKKAPTDESMRLVDEIYEKTKAKIFASYLVRTDLIKFSLIFIENMMNPSFNYVVLIEVNGTVFQREFEIPRQFQRKFTSNQLELDRELLTVILEKVSQIIAFELLKQIDLSTVGLSQDYRR